MPPNRYRWPFQLPAVSRHCPVFDRRLRSVFCNHGEEALHHLELAGARHARQAVEKYLAVTFLDQARVSQHQHAIILDIADQATGALAQSQDRLRQLVITKRIAAFTANTFNARRRHGIARRGKRQLVDYDTTERFTTDINALPETGGAEQHRIATLAKLLQQLAPAGLALHQQRKRQACT